VVPAPFGYHRAVEQRQQQDDQAKSTVMWATDSTQMSLSHASDLEMKSVPLNRRNWSANICRESGYQVGAEAQRHPTFSRNSAVGKPAVYD